MIKLTFPRKLRLLTSNHFTFVFQQPWKVDTPYVIVLGRLNTLGYPRIGLAVAKKHVKLAHERNRIKRLTRESFRLYQHILPTMDFVVIAKSKIIRLNNYTLKEEFKKIWNHYCH